MKKLYEVIIGGNKKVVDQPAIEAKDAQPAKEEVSHMEEIRRVDLKNVVASNVEEVIEKLKPSLKEGQFINSITRLSEVHAE